MRVLYPLFEAGEKNVLGEATILKRLGDNDYLAEYNGVKCHAMFNSLCRALFCGRCVRHCPQFAGARRKINEKYDSAGAGIPARPYPAGKEECVLSDNWVVQNLQNALDTWNKYLSEIWQLITQSPEQFKGGTIWSVIVNINDAVRPLAWRF